MITNLDQLKKTLINEPPYRLKQATTAIFKNLISDWHEATNLPKDLRQRLAKDCPLEIRAHLKVGREKDTVKTLITLDHGLKIESVLMRHGDGRQTVCVSSQVGCPMGCAFCATGRLGFKRNLTAMEIVAQVLFFARYLKKEGQRVTNVVFMGMGEPFLNYDQVIAAIKTLNDSNGLNIGARKISISTVGVIEGVKKLANEKLQINLAISLHAPNDQIRTSIIPANKKYPLKKILAAVDEYIKKTKRQVMFEYLLIKDLNDTDQCALELAELMKKPLYFLNLILYNPTDRFTPSLTKRVKRFKEILTHHGIKFSQRYRLGQDIDAACGQLVGATLAVARTIKERAKRSRN